jgi:putative ABC transport system substrate-binding protein
MRRRDFIGVVAGSAITWPFAAHAQQPERMRRIGVLMGWSEDDASRSYFTSFIERLAQLGWVRGGNAQIELRWTGANPERARIFAKELVALQPDVILCATTPATKALFNETHDIPIVFAIVSDPVGAGVIKSLSRPGGNVTGFINEEADMGGKWLDLLKRAVPDIKRAAIMFNPETAPSAGNYFLGSFKAASASFGMQSITFQVRSDGEIEDAIGSLGDPQTGLVLMTDSFLQAHRLTIIAAAKHNKVPTIFDARTFAQDGGLIAYGSNFDDIFRRAAGHVDRILRGAKPADLPVEVPVIFDLVINLKTARDLGLTIPPSVLATADEVIE